MASRQLELLSHLWKNVQRTAEDGWEGKLDCFTVTDCALLLFVDLCVRVCLLKGSLNCNLIEKGHPLSTACNIPWSFIQSDLHLRSPSCTTEAT